MLLLLPAPTWWYSWEPWEKLKRAMFMPHRSISHRMGTLRIFTAKGERWWEGGREEERCRCMLEGEGSSGCGAASCTGWAHCG